MRRIVCMLLIAFLLALALPAWSELYKCPDGKGGVVFKSDPCEGTWGKASKEPEAPEAPSLPTAKPSWDPTLEEAFKALRKLRAALQVNVSKFEFNRLLIDAQTTVNEVIPLLPEQDKRTSQIKKELEAAIEEYIKTYRIGLIGVDWDPAHKHALRAMELAK